MDAVMNEVVVVGHLSDDLSSIQIDHYQKLRRYYNHLKGIDLEVKFKKFYKKRSIAQNNWMWGVCIPTIKQWLHETTGEKHSSEAIYVFLRQVVVGEEPIIETIEGKEVIIFEGKRFSQCNTVEFSDRVEKIIAYYAERGLVIPLPKPKTNNLITDFIEDE